MPKSISVRVPDELVAKLEAETERTKQTVSEVILRSLEAHLTPDKRQQNLGLMLTRLDQLEFEVIKTRAVALRGLEAMSFLLGIPPLSDEAMNELTDAAHADAETSMDERKRGKS